VLILFLTGGSACLSHRYTSQPRPINVWDHADADCCSFDRYVTRSTIAPVSPNFNSTHLITLFTTLQVTHPLTLSASRLHPPFHCSVFSLAHSTCFSEVVYASPLLLHSLRVRPTS
jgi:hypothetical protein